MSFVLEWKRGKMDSDKYLIKNTSKEERIALIKSWIPDDDAMEDCDIDLWDMYADYINGKSNKDMMCCQQKDKIIIIYLPLKTK